MNPSNPCPLGPDPKVPTNHVFSLVRRKFSAGQTSAKPKNKDIRFLVVCCVMYFYMSMSLHADLPSILSCSI